MKQETIIVRPGSGEIKIFFNENLYDVTKEKLVTEIDACKLNGTIVGADLDYLDSGIIKRNITFACGALELADNHLSPTLSGYTIAL